MLLFILEKLIYIIYVLYIEVTDFGSIGVKLIAQRSYIRSVFKMFQHFLARCPAIKRTAMPGQRNVPCDMYCKFPF